LEIGRLVGRLREQARSHRWVGCGQLEIGRLVGRLREQARSHKSAKAEHMLFTTQWPSVSSPKALDLALPAPSAG
jgi:hypothetical protein